MNNICPLVSVIIPTYNREDKIERAIHSVQVQDYENLEIIIIDDGSNDNTIQKVKKLGNNDSRIKIHINKKNYGPSIARNIGIKLARGDLIAFLDSDDEYIDNHISLCIKEIIFEKVDVCTGFWIEETPDGKQKGKFESGKLREKFEKAIEELDVIQKGDTIYFNNTLCEYIVKKDLYFYHINTFVFEKKLLKKSGIFSKDLYASEDLDFAIRLFLNNKVCCLLNNQFIYHIGNDDSIYNFINRREVNLTEIFKRYDMIKKMTKCDYGKIKMYKKRKKMVKKQDCFVEKKECLSICNEMINSKSFMIAFLNQKNNKKISFYYSFKLLFCPSLRSEAIMIIRNILKKDIYIPNNKNLINFY